MTNILTFLRNIVRFVLSFFPTPLPVGATSYEVWLNDIIQLVGPIADELSLKWVISNEIMRLPPGRDMVPKRLFVKSLRKYAANQVAASKVMEIKQAQEQRAKQAQAEDTANKEMPCPPTNTSA